MSTLTDAWESQLASLLERLSSAQRELLSLLAQKRQMLARRDHQGLASLAARETRLGDELRACYAERQQMLSSAESASLPCQSLADMAKSLPDAASRRMGGAVAASRHQARLLRQECLTQWVVMQHTLLHLAQMLEIIATGGRPQPTYGKGRSVEHGGALIDQAV